MQSEPHDASDPKARFYSYFFHQDILRGSPTTLEIDGDLQSLVPVPLPPLAQLQVSEAHRQNLSKNLASTATGSSKFRIEADE
ncbi:unnamed protein product [Cuscuta campestris]|uniref:Uncharacterized protein n=1 Tax=Cuscuta campestris TaxID=132261 RepID=A0A484KE87_9ASTE|nr:unnamed protein product [Cuscuta campestris]